MPKLTLISHSQCRLAWNENPYLFHQCNGFFIAPPPPPQISGQITYSPLYHNGVAILLCGALMRKTF